MDEEERAMLPMAYKGICQIYQSNMPVLVELYKNRFSAFMKKEIEIGKPIDKKQEKNN
jgi:hypothetical protein